MGTLKKKQATLDKLWIGLILGFVLPLITFYLYYLVKFNDLQFYDYLRSLHHYRLLFKIMSQCVLADLPLFYLFIQFKYYRGARGIVMACFLFAFGVMGYRIVV